MAGNRETTEQATEFEKTSVWSSLTTEEIKMKVCGELEIRNEIKKVQEDHLYYLDRPNVTAMDIGYKKIEGREIDQLALVFWVRKKKSGKELREEEVLPQKIGECIVDVIENEATLGEGRSWPTKAEQAKQEYIMEEKLADSEEETNNVTEPENVGSFARRKRISGRAKCIRSGQALTNYMPRGGDLIQVMDGTEGTLGYFVKYENNMGIISNKHVLRYEKFPVYWSPLNDHIGTVEKLVQTEFVDCGFASLRDCKMNDFRFKDDTQVNTTGSATVGAATKFYGSTSPTAKYGTVLSISWKGKINGVSFSNQIMTTHKISPGDSGSVLVDIGIAENSKAIGLIFARDEKSKFGLANHINNVLEALNVTLATA